ncbi:MAG: hypothetical protein GY716_09320 [bacterium]|nr:hypothetical protein [bacterium]
MNPHDLDVDPETRRALQFDELLEWLAGLARTAPGARRVLALRPVCDEQRIRHELESVREVERLLAERATPVPSGLPDPEEAARALSLAGMRLDATSLRGLAAVAHAAAELRDTLIRLAADSYPRLREQGSRLPDLGLEAAEVLRGIEPDGRLADDASPGLARIRRRRRKAGEDLQNKLARMLRKPGAESVIQDDFVTQRNGRYVIPVRSDSPKPVRGIVHATSSSGATQFVEPLETVELNNEWVRLGEEEREEEQRILADWSDAFRERLDELHDALDALAVVDGWQARALFARDTEAVAPVVGEGEPVALTDVRHPLLERLLAERGGECVPLRLEIEPFDRVLVVSGPNTGGKTVALKTLGLTVLMAQSGIPVPAKRVRLPLYRQLRADIGDHQSIDADLSTFSAHVRSTVEFLGALRPPVLMLFDEIGTGTEPTEGAALAQAVLEKLSATAGVTAAVTTHHGSVKTWAFDNDEVESAAMEFDTDRLRPTYRILGGAAGVSAGLSIAERLGLDADVIERARECMGSDAQQSENYFERLRRLTAELEGRHEEVAEREAELARTRLRLESEAVEQERDRSTRVERALAQALGAFRSTAKKGLAEIKDRRERDRESRRIGRLENRLRMDQSRTRAELVPRSEADESSGWVEPESVEEGMEVLVRNLGKRGRVLAVRGTKVEVELGRIPFTVNRAELRVQPGGAPAAPEPKPPTRPAVPSGGGPTLEPDTPAELHLLGKTVDEAVDEIDQFLDQASVAGHSEVRIVHGHGTGRLKRATREFLVRHVHVKKQRPGRQGEGGDGATIVELKGV